MSYFRLSLILPVLGLAAHSAHADAPPAPSPWKANATLGYIATSSSTTRTQALKAALHGECTEGNWTHEADAGALSTQDHIAGTSSERYNASTKSAININPVNYGYLGTQWENDSSSAYKYQANVNGGFGHYFLKNDVQRLSLEIGAGERHSEPKTAHPRNDVIGTLSLHYRWQINEATRFTQRASMDDGNVGKVIRSYSELKTMLSKKLAASVSYDYKHDSSGTGTHSGITSINLNYDF